MADDSRQPTVPKAQRPRVGYLLRMYPRFSQTFVVNEIVELERQGLALRIASLRTPNEGVFHESITRVQAHADYFSDRFIGQVAKHVRSQWGRLRRDVGAYWRAYRLVRRHKRERLFELVQAVELLKWAKKHRIAHVHVHFGTDEATVALLAHMLGGLSYSMTLHAFDIFRDNVDKELLAAKINASAFTVTVCESNRRYMIREIPGVNPEKIRVSYNGIDLSLFTPGDGPREPMSIFGVGRLIEKKGFDHLIRAVAVLRDQQLPVICRIAGDGRDQKALERSIRKLKLETHVELLGPLRQDEVKAHLKRAACFALPCVQAKDGNVDALPTVLLESLASGCPTVSTRLSGIPEIIEDGTSGLLVEPGTHKPLAEAIRRILVDEALAARLADGGLRRARERFDGRTNVAVMRRWLTQSATPAKDRQPRMDRSEPDAAPTDSTTVPVADASDPATSEAA